MIGLRFILVLNQTENNTNFYYVLANCRPRVIKFKSPNDPIFRVLKASAIVFIGCFISYLKDRKLISQIWRHHLYVFILIWSWIKWDYITCSSRIIKFHRRRWLELLKDYDISVLYHPDMDNIVTNTLSMLSLSSMTYVEEEKK